LFAKTVSEAHPMITAIPAASLFRIPITVISVTKQQAASQGFSGGRLKVLCCNHVEKNGLIYFVPSLKNSDTVKIAISNI